MLTDYTTLEEIRAVLGVSSTELPDSTLLLPMYETLCVAQLEDINTSLPTEYLALAALLPEDRSVEQNRVHDLTRVFSAYATAKELLTSLPMFGVNRLTDGRAEFQRDTRWEDVRDGVDQGYVSIRIRLAAAYVALFPTESVAAAISSTFVSAAGLAVNPVTGA